MIVPEKYNVEKLAAVLKCDNIPIKSGENIEMEMGKQRLLLNKFRKLKHKDGYLEIEYNKKGGFGRQYPKNYVGLSPMKKEIHHYIAGEYYHDIDIVNCHPVLITQLMEKHNITCNDLNEYINNRDNYLSKYNLDKESFFNKVYNLETPPSKAHQEIFEKSILLTKTLLKSSEVHKNIMKQVKLGCRKDRFKNYAGKFLSKIVQNIENDILVEMYNFFISNGYPVYSLMFDGLGIDKNFEVNEVLLQQCCEFVKTKTGYNINLKIKSTDTEWFPITDLIKKEKEDKVIEFSSKTYDNLVAPCWVNRVTGNGSTLDKDLFTDNVIPYLNNFLIYFTEMASGTGVYGWRYKTDIPYNIINQSPDVIYPSQFSDYWVKNDNKVKKSKIVFVADESNPVLRENVHNNYVRPPTIEGHVPDILFDFLKNVICGNEGDELYQYLLKYIYVLVKYGLTEQVLCAFSYKRGLGKSKLVEILKMIVGVNYYKNLTIKDLESQFNPFLMDNLLLSIEELPKDIPHPVEQSIKTYATEHTHYINIKNTKQFSTEVSPNIICTSNYLPSFDIKNGNRRFCFFQVSDCREKDSVYFGSLMKQVEENLSAIRYHFYNLYQDKIRLEAFRPTTKLEKSVLVKSMTSTDMFVDCGLCLMGDDSHPSRVLKKIYNHYREFCKEEGVLPITKNIFSENLKEIGFVSKKIGKANTHIKTGKCNEYLWEEVSHYYTSED